MTPVCHDLRSQIYAPLRTRQHTMAAIEGVTKAIASLLKIQIWSFLVFCYDLRPSIIPANFFRVKCVRFSSCLDRDFRKRHRVFRRFPTTFLRLNFQPLPKMYAD